MALSIGIFFSLMVIGLASQLPQSLSAGLHQEGVPAGVAAQAGQLPPVATLFAAFLGYNPIGHLLAPTGVLASIPPAHVQVLTGTSYFPHLIEGPFRHGLIVVFSAAAAMAAAAALASLMRGGRKRLDPAVAAHLGGDQDALPRKAAPGMTGPSSVPD